MRKVNRILIVLLLCMLTLWVTACADAEPEPTEIPKEQITEYTLIALNPEDILELDAYPNLTEVDLRGSTCYDSILDYIASHPNVNVTYDVQLGTEVYSQDTSELTVTDGTYAFEELLERLAYLKNLSRIDLPQTSLSSDQLIRLMEAYPDVSVTYSVMLQEHELPHDAAQLDLSFLQPETLEQVPEALSKLFAVTEIDLNDPEGNSSLSMENVRYLMDVLPNVEIHYSFTLFGQVLSTMDERVEYLCVEIGNSGVEQVRKALDIMPKCTYFLMDGCGVDNEVMSQLRDYYPNTKIVWRVWLVEEDYESKLYLRCGSYLTDTHRVRTTYVNDSNSHLLNYCTETKYVDVGHVWNLSQCEFLSYMPDLEVCIIAITGITDITPLANHDKLEYLEIFTTDIEDLTPLESCPNIEHLNISNMPKVKDISPLYSLTKLKRLRMVDSPLIPEAQKAEIAEVLPNCEILNLGHFATAWGWRYVGATKEVKQERYALLCEQMEYTIDALEYGIP